MKIAQTILIACIVLTTCVVDVSRMYVSKAFCEELPVLEELIQMNASDQFKLHSWNPLSPSTKELNRARSEYDVLYETLLVRHGYSTAGVQERLDEIWVEAGREIGRRIAFLAMLVSPDVWNVQHWELYKKRVLEMTKGNIY